MNEEPTSHPTVRGHLLVLDDLRLPFRRLKHGLGDL
jgi:hypothetical protein